MADAFYNTLCYPWPGPTGGFVDIFPSSYVSTNNYVLIPPFPLEIIIGQIFVTSQSKQYTIDFFSPQPFREAQHVNVVMNFTGTTYLSSTITTLPSLEVVILPGLDNTGMQYNNTFNIMCTWHQNQFKQLPNGSFDEGDTYIISVDTTCNNQLGVQVLFKRNVGLTLSTNVNNHINNII